MPSPFPGMDPYLEADGLWPEASRYNPAWGRYRKRTTRQIPLVLLQPR